MHSDGAAPKPTARARKRLSLARGEIFVFKEKKRERAGGAQRNKASRERRAGRKEPSGLVERATNGFTSQRGSPAKSSSTSSQCAAQTSSTLPAQAPPSHRFRLIIQRQEPRPSDRGGRPADAATCSAPGKAKVARAPNGER